MSAARISKGEIEVGSYGDDSGCKITVRFEAAGDGPRITLVGGGDCWIWVDMEDVMSLIAALSRAHEELAGASQ